jgi:hypothetical protein
MCVSCVAVSRALVVLALALAVPPLAGATVYAPFDEATLTGLSTAVVTGTVTSSVAHARDGRIVTDTTVLVDRVLKGATAGPTITVTTPGGRVGDRAVVVYGAPRFAAGDPVLLYLQRGAAGETWTTGLALGAYRLETAADGSLVGTRAVPAPERRSLDDVAATTQALGDPGGEVGGAPAPVTAEFTLLGSPPGRWFQADQGQPVRLRMANSDQSQGTSSGGIVDVSLAAWTNVPTASITLERAGSAGTARSIAGGVCDGLSNIMFNDPFNELRGLSQCSGVLAVGGFCSQPGSTGIVDGRVFARISEGDLTLADGLGGCINRRGLEEIITHEVGHVIGLGHSSENQNEPSAALRDATMFFLAHLDGRGAAVMADDVAGVSTIYPVQVDPNDLDGDGVPNDDDACPATRAGGAVDPTGCACGEAGRAACDDGLSCTDDFCDPSTGGCAAGPIDCSGGDPCLAGTCEEATGCSTAPVPGNAAVLCVYARAYPPAACGTTKLPRGIRTRLVRAERRAERGLASGDPKFFASADAQLARALRIVQKAGARRRRPLPSACADALAALVAEARTRLPTTAN